MNVLVHPSQIGALVDYVDGGSVFLTARRAPRCLEQLVARTGNNQVFGPAWALGIAQVYRWTEERRDLLDIDMLSEAASFSTYGFQHVANGLAMVHDVIRDGCGLSPRAPGVKTFRGKRHPVFTGFEEWFKHSVASLDVDVPFPFKDGMLEVPERIARACEAAQVLHVGWCSGPDGMYNMLRAEVTRSRELRRDAAEDG